MKVTFTFLLTKMMTKICFCFYILLLQIIFSVNGKDQKGFLCLMLSSIFRGWRKLSKLDFPTGNCHTGYFPTGNFPKGTFPSGTFPKRTFPTGRELFPWNFFPRDIWDLSLSDFFLLRNFPKLQGKVLMK